MRDPERCSRFISTSPKAPGANYARLKSTDLNSSMFPVPGSVFVFRVPVPGAMFMVLRSMFVPLCANQLRKLEPRTLEPRHPNSNSEHEPESRNVELGTAWI